jgi:DNA-binding HxlR family transcriptional regulator
VVRELLFAHPEPRRFGELLDELPGMSRSLLMGRLRELEEAGIVRPHAQGTARAIGGWSLTERGASLAPAVRAMAEWSFEEIEDPTGAPRAAIRRQIESLG